MDITQPKRRCGTFYVPKLILIGLIWLAAVVLSTWQAVVERTDPAYNLKVDTVNFMVSITTSCTSLSYQHPT